MRLLIAPQFRGNDEGDGGIRRVVEAQHKYLPEFGIEIVDTVEQADVVAVHAGYWIDTRKPVVSHCHGLYWNEYPWALWAEKLNLDVIEAIRKADHVTAPSEWVANALRRGMLLNPTTLYHGIDPEDWSPGENGGYTLWNKTRVDPICDPRPVIELATRLPHEQFISTFSAPAKNIKETGRLPFEEAKAYIRNANVYLATSRETFGIGTIEAMACGVPILGFNWGGQAEFIEHKVDGYLVAPNDYDALAEGLQYVIAHRNEMGEAAKRKALQRFTWRTVMKDYAALYERVLEDSRIARPKISVVIPCYNLAHMLRPAIDSVLYQRDQVQGDVEIIVVDDNSPDNTEEVVKSYHPNEVTYIRNEKNQYLAGVLNIGIRASTGDYIVPLDADNMLGPNALALLSQALDRNRNLDIVYGAFEVISPDGTHAVSQWPPKVFDFKSQMNKRNQIPSTSMYRRKVWERIGGYRRRCRTADDADFWCRASSYGMQPAKVTDAVTLIYNDRMDSMSRNTADWDWTAWYPWSRIPALTPFGAIVDGKKSVPSYEPTIVSVIIPVGPKHTEIIVDAIDSLMAQTFQQWECIVVNDSDKEIPWLPSFVRTYTTKGEQGPAVARNLGAKHAKGHYLLFLDADDFLSPLAIESFVRAQKEFGGYIYSDWYIQETGEHKQVNDYACDDLLRLMPHAVTALYPRKAFEEVGGFDESLNAWEDWDLLLNLANIGMCGVRIPEPLFYYRIHAGERRETLFANRSEGKDNMVAKWGPYFRGEKQLMACSSCGRGGGAIVRSKGASSQSKEAPAQHDGMTLLEYVGNNPTMTFRGSGGVNYRFGADQGHKVRYVNNADVSKLLGSSFFREVSVQEVNASPVDNVLVAVGPPNGYD